MSARIAPASYAPVPPVPVTGTLITYRIDGQNRRVQKRVNGAAVQGWLYRDGLAPVAELEDRKSVV